MVLGSFPFANGDTIGAWEAFEVAPLGGYQIALKSFNGQYLVAEGGGGQAVYANRNAVGAWEIFMLEER